MTVRYQIKICLVDTETKIESGELLSSVSFEENEYSMTIDNTMWNCLAFINENIRYMLYDSNLEEVEE